MPRKPSQKAAKRQKPSAARKPRATKAAAYPAPSPVTAPAPAAPAQAEAPKVQRELRSFHWPKTWWDAVKERWAPLWWLSFWPVKYEWRHYWEDVLDETAPTLADWSPANLIEPGTTLMVDGKPVGVAVSETTGSRGVYTITTVTNPPPVSAPQVPPPAPLHEDEDPYLTPKQMGWNDAERGLYRPEIYGAQAGWEYVAYCYGYKLFKAGKPFPLGLD
jgi:hypothetical protein